MSQARACPICRSLLLLPDGAIQEPIVCRCKNLLYRHALTLVPTPDASTGSTIACPHCALTAVVPPDVSRANILCLQCRAEFGASQGIALEISLPDLAVSGLPAANSGAPEEPIDLGDGLLMGGKSTASTTESTARTSPAPPKKSHKVLVGIPIPPGELVRSGGAPGGAGARLIWGVVLLSILCSGAIVAWFLMKPPPSPGTRYLPEHCGWVGYIPWEKIKQSEGFRRLQELGGWSERDEEEQLRFLGVPPRDLASILVAGDEQGLSGLIAVVETRTSVEIESVLQHLRCGQPTINAERSDVFLVGKTGYCRVEKNRLLVGEPGQIQRVLERRGAPAALSTHLEQFVHELPGSAGVRVVGDASFLRQCHLDVLGVDLRPVLKACAPKDEPAHLHCEFPSGLRLAIVLANMNSHLTAVDAAQRARIVERLPFLASFFDAGSWKRTNHEVRWNLELEPRVAVEPFLEAVAPLYYWARVLQEANHPRQGEARARLRAAAAEAVPHLARGLSRGEPEARLAVLRMLAELGPAAAPAAAQVVQALEDGSASVRREAVLVVPVLAPAAPQVRLEVLKSLNDPDAAVGEAARLSVRKIRPLVEQERPMLLQLLKTPLSRQEMHVYLLTALHEDRLVNSEAQEAMVRCLQSNPLSPVRKAAAEALGRSAAARPVAHALLKALRDDASEVRLAACESLGTLAADLPEVIADLIGALDLLQADVQARACASLAKLGPKAVLARPLLLRLARRDHAVVQASARLALASIGLPQPADAPMLAQALKTSADRNVRSCAATLLGELGPRADSYLMALCEQVDSEDSGIRLAALEAIRQHGDCPPRLVPALMRALDDASALGVPALVDQKSPRPLLEVVLGASRNKETRLNILRSLESMGAKAGNLTGAVMPRLKDDEVFVRLQAVKTFAAICPDRDLAKFVPALTEAMSEKDNAVRHQVMALIKARGAPLAPLLRHGLASQDLDLRSVSLETAKSLGPGAADCLPELRKCLAPSNPANIRLAALAAVDATSAADKAVKELDQVLKDDDAPLRKAALAVLAGLGPRALPAKDNVVALLRTGERAEFEAAHKTFHELRLEAKEAVFLLIGAFRNPDPEVRVLLVTEIRKLGKPALPTLIQQLDHVLPSIRMGVVLTLGQFGGEADRAIPPLLKRLAVEAEPNLREEISKTLQKIKN